MDKRFKRVIHIPSRPYNAWCKHLVRAFTELNDTDTVVAFRLYNEAYDGVNVEITAVTQADADYWYEWVLSHMLKADAILSTLEGIAQNENKENDYED